MSARPADLNPADLNAERVEEIERLLTHESSVSFYSPRAHESMWLLVDAVKRLTAGADDDPGPENAEATPGQWVRRFLDAPAHVRLSIARYFTSTARLATTCLVENHRKRLGGPPSVADDVVPLLTLDLAEPPLTYADGPDPDHPVLAFDVSGVPEPFSAAAGTLADNFDDAQCEVCKSRIGGWLDDADEDHPQSRWVLAVLVVGRSGRVAALCEDCAPYDPPLTAPGEVKP